jgi:hypothetical protein
MILNAVSNLYANVNNNNQVHNELMIFMILDFNAVFNLYANVNNNNQVHDDLYDPRLQRRLQTSTPT